MTMFSFTVISRITHFMLINCWFFLLPSFRFSHFTEINCHSLSSLDLSHVFFNIRPAFFICLFYFFTRVISLTLPVGERHFFTLLFGHYPSPISDASAGSAVLVSFISLFLLSDQFWLHIFLPAHRHITVKLIVHTLNPLDHTSDVWFQTALKTNVLSSGHRKLHTIHT